MTSLLILAGLVLVLVVLPLWLKKGRRGHVDRMESFPSASASSRPKVDEGAGKGETPSASPDAPAESWRATGRHIDLDEDDYKPSDQGLPHPGSRHIDFVAKDPSMPAAPMPPLPYVEIPPYPGHQSQVSPSLEEFDDELEIPAFDSGRDDARRNPTIVEPPVTPSPTPTGPSPIGPVPVHDPNPSGVEQETGYHRMPTHVIARMRSPNSGLVRVFFATDRQQVAAEFGVSYDRHRSDFGELEYGVCEISIPKVHETGKLESPSWLRFEFRPNPEKHIVLTQCETLEEQLFVEEVRETVAGSPRKDAFVFIHGYNVSFEDAARRTGQIAYDLNFAGAPIFYSWPSNGALADYIKDETNISWTAPHFERFLAMLAESSGAERIHILAHSMGNRAACEALKSLSRAGGTGVRFTHLVLAAPDIDAQTFAELAQALTRVCGQVTLYESSNDKALQASKRIHGNPRAGEPLLILPGLDTIDVSGLDTDFLGHSYFSDTWPLLSDIHSVIMKDEKAAERFGLKKIAHAHGEYFAFK